MVKKYERNGLINPFDESVAVAELTTVCWLRLSQRILINKMKLNIPNHKKKNKNSDSNTSGEMEAKMVFQIGKYFFHFQIYKKHSL